ncbi:MAG: nitroreductase family protein [Candidatus Heimdallarchaeaceae archaeon]
MAEDVIFTRRSIRKYKPQPVPKETLEYILRAAMAAPSARNLQPWHFVIIDDRKILNKIPDIQPYTKMLYEAPLAIVVCGDTKISEAYWVQDCSAATQNILLAAKNKGLGSVWCGIYPREKRVKALKELLKLPEHIVPLNVVAIGYPNETKPPVDRYDKAKIHYNGW